MTKKSVSMQAYHKSIAALEKQLKDPELLIDKVPKLQEQLVKIAEKYQDDESIGQERYKIYELQALIFFYQDNDEEALNLLDSARTVYGGSYKYEQNLRKQIVAESPKLSSKYTLSGILRGETSGRINRADYLVGILTIYALSIGAGLPMILAISGNIMMMIIAIILALSWFVWCMVLWVRLVVRRLHDIGLSEWCALMIIVPLANFILGLVLLFYPGESHKNKYGNRP